MTVPRHCAAAAQYPRNAVMCPSPAGTDVQNIRTSCPHSPDSPFPAPCYPHCPLPAARSSAASRNRGSALSSRPAHPPHRMPRSGTCHLLHPAPQTDLTRWPPPALRYLPADRRLLRLSAEAHSRYPVHSAQKRKHYPPSPLLSLLIRTACDVHHRISPAVSPHASRGDQRKNHVSSAALACHWLRRPGKNPSGTAHTFCNQTPP